MNLVNVVVAFSKVNDIKGTRSHFCTGSYVSGWPTKELFKSGTNLELGLVIDVTYGA